MVRIRIKHSDPDPYQIEKQDQDPDPYQSDKKDPDPDQKVLLRNTVPVTYWYR
jgi:hypothetical protein